MPNHVHGIIEVDDSIVKTEPSQDFVQPFRSPSKTIGSIVRGFKIGVTKWFRNTYPEDFPLERTIWLRNYHEYIIRDHEAYLNISNYIKTNPKRWKEDQFLR